MPFFFSCFYVNSAQTSKIFCCFVGRNCGLCVRNIFSSYFSYFCSLSIFIYFCKSLLPKMSNDVTHHLLVRKHIKSLLSFFFVLYISFHLSLYKHHHLKFDVVVLKVLQENCNPATCYEFRVPSEKAIHILLISRFS